MQGDSLATEASVRRVIAAFDGAAIPGHQWCHEVRLMITGWYLLIHDEAEATARLVSRMRALARTDDALCYNETMTLFWMAIGRLFLSTMDPTIDRIQRLNRFLEAYRTRETLILEHYSHRRLYSSEARWSWVDPDVRPLPAALDPSKRGGDH